MTDNSTTPNLDESTPPIDVETNIVDDADPTVEFSKNQDPVADLDEEV